MLLSGVLRDPPDSRDFIAEEIFAAEGVVSSSLPRQRFLLDKSNDAKLTLAGNEVYDQGDSHHCLVYAGCAMVEWYEYHHRHRSLLQQASLSSSSRSLSLSSSSGPSQTPVVNEASDIPLSNTTFIEAEAPLSSSTSLSRPGGDFSSATFGNTLTTSSTLLGKQEAYEDPLSTTSLATRGGRERTSSRSMLKVSSLKLTPGQVLCQRIDDDYTPLTPQQGQAASTTQQGSIIGPSSSVGPGTTTSTLVAGMVGMAAMAGMAGAPAFTMAGSALIHNDLQPVNVNLDEDDTSWGEGHGPPTERIDREERRLPSTFTYDNDGTPVDANAPPATTWVYPSPNPTMMSQASEDLSKLVSLKPAPLLTALKRLLSFEQEAAAATKSLEAFAIPSFKSSKRDNTNPLPTTTSSNPPANKMTGRRTAVGAAHRTTTTMMTGGGRSASAHRRGERLVSELLREMTSVGFSSSSSSLSPSGSQPKRVTLAKQFYYEHRSDKSVQGMLCRDLLTLLTVISPPVTQDQYDAVLKQRQVIQKLQHQLDSNKTANDPNPLIASSSPLTAKGDAGGMARTSSNAGLLNHKLQMQIAEEGAKLKALITSILPTTASKIASSPHLYARVTTCQGLRRAIDQNGVALMILPLRNRASAEFWKKTVALPTTAAPTVPLPMVSPTNKDDDEEEHAVAVVAYSDTKAAFLLRNSWGINWNQMGHTWLPYSELLRYASFIWTIFFNGKDRLQWWKNKVNPPLPPPVVVMPPSIVGGPIPGTLNTHQQQGSSPSSSAAAASLPTAHTPADRHDQGDEEDNHHNNNRMKPRSTTMMMSTTMKRRGSQHSRTRSWGGARLPQQSSAPRQQQQPQQPLLQSSLSSQTIVQRLRDWWLQQ